MKHIVWIALGWFVLTLSAHAASFDCAKAGTKVEHLICENPELSKLDENLSSAYATVLKDSSRSESIRNAQRKWMSIRNSCPDFECVKDAYSRRFKVLEQSAMYGEYVPYQEKPYGEYNSKLCDKFIMDKNGIEIRDITPSDASNLLKQCPDIFRTLSDRMPDEYSLYRADIDNDGVKDQVLSSAYYFTNRDSHSLDKVDVKTCTLTPVFEAYGPKRLLVADGVTYIESTEICRGPYSIKDKERYLQCRELYRKSTNITLKKFRDEVCVFIEKDWLQFKPQ